MSNRDSFPCQATTFEWRIELFWVVYYQQWAAIFLFLFLFLLYLVMLKMLILSIKEKKTIFFPPWFIKLWDVTYVCNVHGAEM